MASLRPGKMVTFSAQPSHTTTITRLIHPANRSAMSWAIVWGVTLARWRVSITVTSSGMSVPYTFQIVSYLFAAPLFVIVEIPGQLGDGHPTPRTEASSVRELHPHLRDTDAERGLKRSINIAVNLIVRPHIFKGQLSVQAHIRRAQSARASNLTVIVNIAIFPSRGHIRSSHHGVEL